MKKMLFILFLFVSCSMTTEKGTISGKVVSVADGDTMTILTADKKQIKIRMLGIDAPERGQDFGTVARQQLNNLCYGKTVIVEKKDEDQYGRVLGVVYVDGMNVNEYMVRNGLAWYYRHFVNDPRLDSLELLARKEKVNIWSMKNPMPPYEFRKSRR
ncbi:thermonuclease family protein [Dysgonomonas reticulitermitis]